MCNNPFFDGNGITGASETGKTINMAYPHKNRSDRVQNLIVEHDGELYGRSEFMGKTYAEMQAKVLGAEHADIMKQVAKNQSAPIDPKLKPAIKIPCREYTKEEVRSALKRIEKLLPTTKPFSTEFKIGIKK